MLLVVVSTYPIAVNGKVFCSIETIMIIIIIDINVILLKVYELSFFWNRSTQSIVQNIKRESLRGIGGMDKAVRETPPLECHLDIQWEWKGNLGKI